MARHSKHLGSGSFIIGYALRPSGTAQGRRRQKRGQPFFKAMAFLPYSLCPARNLDGDRPKCRLKT